MLIVAIVLVGGVSILSIKGSSDESLTSGVKMANIDALSNSESGAKCPNGCSSIGWGWDKILECDCNYDHLSCCDRWGC